MEWTSELAWLISLPVMASPVIYLVGRLVARRWGDSTPKNPAGWLAMAVLLADLVFLWQVGQKIQNGQELTWQVGMILLAADGLAFLLAAVVLVLGIVVVWFSIRYMQGEIGEEKFYTLLVAMIGTIIGLGFARDLFNLWVWFEAMAVTSYMLVAFYREQPASLEAGFKYLVQSATGSVLVLLGVALLFARNGTLRLGQLNTAPLDWMAVAAGALFVIGFGVKVALVPLHTWLPDAHSQAPSGISAMLSGVVIEAGLVALLRTLAELWPSADRFGILLLGFAAVNMLLGNLMALRQTQVKRLLAFSSVSHIGYMLVGLGAGMAFGQAAGVGGAFFHLITHAAMKGLAFLSAGALLYSIHLANGGHGPLVLDDLNGAASRYPLAAFTLSIAVLGLGGLPPLAGFMSKWQIFVAGFSTSNPWMIAIVIFAALNSLLSLAYYAPIVNRMYRNEIGPAIKTGKALSLWMTAPLVILAVVVIVAGFWPPLLSWLSDLAAGSLQSILIMGGR